jgi:hypothetical protein
MAKAKPKDPTGIQDILDDPNSSGGMRGQKVPKQKKKKSAYLRGIGRMLNGNKREMA